MVLLVQLEQISHLIKACLEKSIEDLNWIMSFKFRFLFDIEENP